MLLQCRNQSPDLGNNLYAPAENRKQRVRQIAELRERLGPSLLLRMRIFLGKMLPLELKTPSWHHTRAKALTHPTGQPTVTLHIISARTWHRLRWAWAGRWKPPALSPTGPALHPWSLSETCTSAFAPTGFGIRSQRWLTEQRPHQLPGAWHAHPWAPPALQGYCVIRDKKDLDVFTTWARLCRQGDWAWEKRANSPKATHLVRSENWSLTQPSPPLPSCTLSEERGVHCSMSPESKSPGPPSSHWPLSSHWLQDSGVNLFPRQIQLRGMWYLKLTGKGYYQENWLFAKKFSHFTLSLQRMPLLRHLS